jgi:hypothetical protein
MGKAKKAAYVLEDMSRDPISGVPNKPLGSYTHGKSPWLGHALCATPLEAHTAINFTGPVGAASAVYYSLIFQLGKWEYNGVQKFDEWIEVSPVHQAYYQLTQRQKEDLEGKIKAGLASAAQAVADYELLMHDKRKYEEMLHYMGYQTRHMDDNDQIDFSDDDDEKKKKARAARQDNHSLKAMFIDQVDVHTGEGISMRSIVQRWPTLISDFMKLDDGDMNPDKVRVKLDISRAEAVVLITKNKLFLEWKALFLADLNDRYRRIMGLVRSRQKSVEEYKKWLEPVVARHRLIKEGLSSASGSVGSRASMVISPYSTAGHPSSGHEIVLWAWKDFLSPEIYKVSSEQMQENEIDPYDDWTKKTLIWNEEQGLIVKYPWITDEWIRSKLDAFKKNGWLKLSRHYYSFFQITFQRFVFRTPQGEEFEDGTFDINLATMSLNVMFVKLLELAAKQEEFNKYVDDMLGIAHKIPGKAHTPKKDGGNPIADLLDKVNINLMFFKRGPYERDFNDRITKYYLLPIAGDRYVPMVNFIKSKLGFGK